MTKWRKRTTTKVAMLLDMGKMVVATVVVDADDVAVVAIATNRRVTISTKKQVIAHQETETMPTHFEFHHFHHYRYHCCCCSLPLSPLLQSNSM